MNATLVAVFCYILVTIAIGIWASRRTKSESDYLIAGRRLPFSVCVFTVFATWFGAETCTGAAGAVYSEGLRGARLDPFGYMFCLVLYGLVFAAPFWRRGITTLADVFRQRFSPGVEKFAALLLIPTSLLWAAAQVGAFGHIISALSGGEIEVRTAIAIATAAVIIYTGTGGMLADAVTDVVQGIVLIIGLYILAIVVVWDLYAAGTLGDTIAAIHGAEAEPEPFLVSIEAWAIPIIGSIISQELVSRSMAAKSANVARASGITAGGLYLIVGLAPITIGLLAQSVIPNIEEAEQVLPLMAEKYLHGAFYVVLIGALVSAILSTVDSALLACGGLFSHNLVMPLLKEPSEKLKLRISRTCVIAFGALSFLLAISNDDVRELVEEASSFGTAGIFTAVVFGLFTRYGGVITAYATLFTGVSVYGGLYYGPAMAERITGGPITMMAPLETFAQSPYVCSVVAALGCYTVLGMFEKAKDAAIAPVLQESFEEE